MNQEKLPSREELVVELETLKRVSAKNEELTKKLSEGVPNPQEIQKEIQSCIDQQSRIVDKFVALCDDENAKQKFQDIVKKIENLTQILEQAAEEEKIEALKKQILEEVGIWIKQLEAIIMNVINKTK